MSQLSGLVLLMSRQSLNSGANDINSGANDINAARRLQNPSRKRSALRCSVPETGDVEEADRTAFELRTLRLVALDVRQARDAVALKAPMQR